MVDDVVKQAREVNRFMATNQNGRRMTVLAIQHFEISNAEDGSTQTSETYRSFRTLKGMALQRTAKGMYISIDGVCLISTDPNCE